MLSTRFLTVLALSLTCLLAPSAAADSLLPSGTFEKANAAGDWPQGWPKGKNVTWEEEEGNRFLRLQASGADEMLTLFHRVQIPPEVEALELTFRARVSELKKGAENYFDARVIMNFKGAAGEPLGSARPISFGKDTAGWVQRSARFVLPKGATALDFMPSLFRVKAGRLDLDDIVLQPISRTVVEAEQAALVAPSMARQEPPNEAKWPEELAVVGNRLQTKSGRPVWLQGVNVPSLEWSVKGENVLSSIPVAIEEWKSNVIRLPVKDDYWFGRSGSQTDAGKTYRDLVDAAITLAANRGAYLVLDLHTYRAPKAAHIAFWKEAAERYRNHPAVLFDLINEPHGISWEIWRNGGFVEERTTKADEDVFLNEQEKENAKRGFQSPGMQALVDAVRETGARNIVIAGGLDWAYDLSGILEGYALEERAPGNGIMYSTHVYPWKRDWQGKFLQVAEKHPILVGEVGADEKKMDFMPAEIQENAETWVPAMLGLIQKHQLNWTGWTFHPKATPRMIDDWKYTPTPFWGVPAKRALAGEQFPLEKLR